MAGKYIALLQAIRNGCVLLYVDWDVQEWLIFTAHLKIQRIQKLKKLVGIANSSLNKEFLKKVQIRQQTVQEVFWQ